HTDTGRGALLQGLVLFAQTLKLILGIFVGHALASLSGRAPLYRCLLAIYSTDVPLPPPVSGALFAVSLRESDAPCQQSRENRLGLWWGCRVGEDLRKVGIESALNGAWGRERQPAIPISVEEIVADGVAAARAGAAIIHLHAYDAATGRQRDTYEIYA